MSLSTTLEQDYVDYLKYKRYRERTIVHKLICIRRYVAWLEKENLGLTECTYADVLGFLREQQKENYSIANQNTHLRAIRHLYEGMIMQDKARYNPVANLRVKGHVYRLPHNLLSTEQMQKIYDSYRPQTDYQLRNKTILGLYINQALMRAEMSNLEVSDINLVKGTVRIRKNIKLAERVLPLAAYQVLTLQEYIYKIRPQLVKQNPDDKGDRLFFTAGNGQTVNEALRKLLHDLMKKHTELTSLHQIRSSVIAEWIKNKPIREVQYMSGHTHLRSTQRYRDLNLQDLQESLNEHHPLQK
ncbi:MAG: tyrosine-type recombinase/integrase [Verrucomicrobia bacterium]|nr:tyrosine-type recombinase/integrase [Verrucomicrobiota bacterium]